MSKWQIIGLIAVVLVMVVLIVLFWGSLFSIVLTMGLLLIPSVYLFNRFLNTDRTSDFIDDDNW